MPSVDNPSSFAINARSNPLMSDPLRNFRFLVSFRPYSKKRPNLQNMGKSTMDSAYTFGFTSVSGLTVATESIPYREGGMNTTLHQVPGQSTFSPVTLSRGVHIGNGKAWRWMRRMFSVTAAPGRGQTTETGINSTPDYNFRSSVDIMVLTHPPDRTNDNDNRAYAAGGTRNDTIAVAYRLYNAWISSLAYSDLNAGDNAILVEQIVLAHEGFDMYWWDGVGEPQNAETASAGDSPLFSH